MFRAINKWINLKFGLRYWYQVRFCYRAKNAEYNLFDWQQQVGLTDMRTILKGRDILKRTTPLHHKKWLKKHLCNGTMHIEVICYLGRFKQN